ncbi:MAG: CBS domain-containing protein [Thermoproteota archaeon]
MRGRLRKQFSTRISEISVLNYATSPPLSVTKTTPLLRVLETMVARDFRRIFVTTPDGFLEGVITPMEVVKYLYLKWRNNPEIDIISILNAPVVKIMRRDVATIKQSESVTQSVVFMRQRGVNGLAVVDKEGSLKAVLTVRDVLEKFNYRLTPGTIEMVFSRSPVCISSDRMLKDGIETMINSNHRRLPCLEGSKPIGLFSSRSIVVFLGGKEFLREAWKPVDELMKMHVNVFTIKDIPILEPEISISEAWEIIKRSSYGSALVVKNYSLEGFLTEMDFLKAVEI